MLNIKDNNYDQQCREYVTRLALQDHVIDSVRYCDEPDIDSDELTLADMVGAQQAMTHVPELETSMSLAKSTPTRVFLSKNFVLRIK